MNGADRSPLFAPLKLGAFNLAHRIVLSADRELPAAISSMTPVEVFGDYYRDRTSPGGLVICGTSLNAQSPPSGNELLPRTTKLVNEWRLVTDLIRTAGGLSVLQLAHPRSLLTAPLCVEDLDEALDEYRTLADNAGDAGFDGVEVTCLPSLGRGPTRGEPDAANEATLRQFFLAALSSVTSVWPAQRVGLCCTDSAVTDETPLSTFDAVIGHCSAFLRVKPSDPSRVASVATGRRELLRTRGVGLVSCGPWSAIEAARAVQALDVDCVAPDGFSSQANLYQMWSRGTGTLGE